MERARTVFMADLKALRVLIALVAFQWAAVLILWPTTSTARWPILPFSVWGWIWFGYGVFMAVGVFSGIRRVAWIEFAANCVGFFVMAAWVYSYVGIGTYPPAPIACLLMAVWLFIRSGDRT